MISTRAGKRTLASKIRALFRASEKGVWYDPSDLTSMFQDSAGTTAAVVGQPVGLMLDKSQGLTGISTIYKGLSGTFDYYIDASAGSDANAGTTLGAAWKSLSKITGALTAAGSTTRIRVVTGTYATVDDHFTIDNGATGSTLEIVFEPGCVMDGSVASALANTLPVYVGDLGTFTCNLYGNGLTIQDYNYTTGGASPNGIGYGGAGVVVNVYDTTIDGCVDGVSGHNSGHCNLYDCTVQNSIKWVIANVSASTMTAHRCNFVSSGLETAGISTDSGSAGLAEFHDCVISSAVNPSKNWEMNNTGFYRCQFGTTVNSINVVYATGGPTYINYEDSFVNGRFQLFANMTFTRCFGLFSGRVRNDTGTFAMRNCVFSGPATGLTNIFYSNFDDLGAATLVVNNNIFETATAAAFMSVDATNATYLVSSSSNFFNNILSGSAAFDADLIAADSGGTVIVNNITGDALIGAANTLLMADYAFAIGSPAIGAATDGGDSGFGVADVVVMSPQEVRGPGAIPGYHATSTARPIVGASLVDLDGVDDSLSIATGAGGGAAGFFLCAAVRPDGGAGAVRVIWSDAGTNTGYIVRINASNQLEIAAGNGTTYTLAATTDTLEVGTTYLVTAWDDGTNLNVQVNSGTVGTAARPVVSAGNADARIGKDYGAATGWFNGAIYPLVYVKNGENVDAADRTAVKSYVASKAGVAF